MAISKRKIFLGLPIALISGEIYLGILAGYLIGKFLAGKKAGEKGIIKSIILPIGKYRFHLHHWLWGTGGMVAALAISFSPPFPQVSYGILAGLILQGIFAYPDWHNFIKKP